MGLAATISWLLSVTLALTAAASDESTFSSTKEVSTTITNEVNYLPPMVVLGTRDGNIVRCPFATPNSCETYHIGQSKVTATLIHGEYLFAALESGSMLRCFWHRIYSCRAFHQADSKITGLAVLAGSVHASLDNGVILKCNMNVPYSCQLFANTGNTIRSLAASSSYLYAGSSHAQIDRCNTSGICSKYRKNPYDYDVTGLTVAGNTVYGLLSGGFFQLCNETSEACKSAAVTESAYEGVTVFNSNLYMLREEKELRSLAIGSVGSDGSSLYSTYGAVSSISIAYGTYAMQEKYRIESVKCIWNGVFTCPPTVFYYDDIKQRSTLEVFVKDGRLYDSQGVVVDTRNADESYSQRAAIFAMGPDGQILLSNVHKPALLHTSSLFAGNPVSGAGLMVVSRGKIVNITDCSVHYRPDQDLNDQVRDALRTKGYTDNIDFHPCSYEDQLCLLDGTGKRKLE